MREESDGKPWSDRWAVMAILDWAWPYFDREQQELLEDAFGREGNLVELIIRARQLGMDVRYVEAVLRAAGRNAEGG